MVEQTQLLQAKQQLEEDSPAIIARFRAEYEQGRIPDVPFQGPVHQSDLRRLQLTFVPILSVDPQQWSCKIKWLIPALRADQCGGPAEEVRSEKDFKLAVVGTDSIPMTQGSCADSQAQPQANSPILNEHTQSSEKQSPTGFTHPNTQND